jgi:hypothetical protein
MEQHVDGALCVEWIDKLRTDMNVVFFVIFNMRIGRIKIQAIFVFTYAGRHGKDWIARGLFFLPQQWHNSASRNPSRAMSLSQTANREAESENAEIIKNTPSDNEIAAAGQEAAQLRSTFNGWLYISIYVRWDRQSGFQ